MLRNLAKAYGEKWCAVSLLFFAWGSGFPTHAAPPEGDKAVTPLQKSAKASADDGLKVERLSKPPPGLVFQGRFQVGIRCFDKSGENIVILSKKIDDTRRSEDLDEELNQELFAYRFVVQEDKTLKQAWRVYDFVKGCPVDSTGEFILEALGATDLNHDGVAEIWLMYVIGCKGDVSPWGMKIIMYEGAQKFAMRGEQKMIMPTQGGGKTSYGGKYQFDSAFQKAPKEFREFAKKLWTKYGVEDRSR